MATTSCWWDEIHWCANSNFWREYAVTLLAVTIKKIVKTPQPMEQWAKAPSGPKDIKACEYNSCSHANVMKDRIGRGLECTKDYGDVKWANCNLCRDPCAQLPRNSNYSSKYAINRYFKGGFFIFCKRLTRIAV